MCGLRPHFVTACSQCVLQLTVEKLVVYSKMQIHVIISCMFTECLEYIPYCNYVLYCAPHNTFAVMNTCIVLP